ncbi:ESPR-type extended signal peptide-containing protein [Dyella flagellata]|uniref:YadA-like C-terminal region n=1 Tax=Dyella flagellata TaxID=1867833 RepID=A0ABQ5X9A9_9GAMM|nr:ESPR-type extended signal peptide-containing protein [Dyella flagellata]GLQ88160.1 hypothetical protein GCM10007898_17290 [Dyella flagellata]
MNRNYRIVWNEASRKWVVASELTGGRKKKTATMASLAIAMALGLSVSHAAMAKDASDVTSRLADIEKRVTAVETNTSDIANDARTYSDFLGKVINKVGNDVDDNSAKIKAIDNREDKDAGMIVKGMANIDGRVTDNAAHIADVDARQDKDAGMIVKGMVNIDGRVSSIQQDMDRAVIGAGATATGTNSSAIGPNASAPGNNSVALGSDSVADRDNSVSVGSPGHERQITNVAPGTERTDAANWGQVQDAVGSEHNWASDQFRRVDRRIDGMGAMTAAYGQMAFSAAGVDATNRVGAGVGYQNGQTALAVGISHRFGTRVNLSVGASTTGKDTSAGAGVAVGW